jgi:hypothetical protein
LSVAAKRPCWRPKQRVSRRKRWAIAPTFSTDRFRSVLSPLWISFQRGFQSLASSGWNYPWSGICFCSILMETEYYDLEHSGKISSPQDTPICSRTLRCCPHNWMVV